MNDGNTSADSQHGKTHLRREVAWWCLVGVTMLAASIWATRPLASSMWDHVANQDDALYTAWALQHNYEVFETRAWSEYWRAPMLHPYPYSLALADIHLGTAIWTWPMYWITRSAVFAQNFAIFGSFILSGMACTWLAMQGTGRRWLALALGIAGMISPYRLAHIGHLQLLMTQWIVLSVCCLLECSRRPHWGYVLAFGTCSVMTLTICLSLCCWARIPSSGC